MKESPRRSRRWCKPPVRVSYERFRTNLTFGLVRKMLWVNNPDPTTWRYKRRGSVLGFWRMLKQAMYQEYRRRLREGLTRTGSQCPF